MNNKLSDLNNHLFAEIERLSDEDIKGEALDEEIKRAKAITSISGRIIENADLVLKAEKFKTEFAIKPDSVPKMLEG